RRQGTFSVVACTCSLTLSWSALPCTLTTTRAVVLSGHAFSWTLLAIGCRFLLGTCFFFLLGRKFDLIENVKAFQFIGFCFDQLLFRLRLFLFNLRCFHSGFNNFNFFYLFNNRLNNFGGFLFRRFFFFL